MHAACHATTNLKFGSCIALPSSSPVIEASKLITVEIKDMVWRLFEGGPNTHKMAAAVQTCFHLHICSTFQNCLLALHYTIYNEKYFSERQFSYIVRVPNLEGIKDALFYKFRRLTIGRNCSAMCTNEVARA